MKRTLSCLALVGLMLLLSAPAGAVTIVTNSSFGIGSGSGYTNSWAFTAGGITATVTAYANTGGGGTFTRAQVGRHGGGLGVCNTIEGLGCSSPAHQADNGTSIDMLLITFNQAVQVQSLSLNMYGVLTGVSSMHDSDLTYFVGTATDAALAALLPTLTSTTITQNANNGLLNLPLTDTSFAGVNTASDLNRTATLNTGDVNYLIIMPKIGDADDYFKLYSLDVVPGTNTNNGGVPEPSTYAMLGCGLVALGYFRRFRKN